MLCILVEGPGDVKGIPNLINRYLGIPLDQIHCLSMNGKANIVRNKRNDGFEATIIRRKRDCQKFIVLMDDDVTFGPYHHRGIAYEHEDMPVRAERVSSAYSLMVEVCWAKIEGESWLIGGLNPGVCNTTDFDDTEIPLDTTSQPPDPKLWIKERLRDHSYHEAVYECLSKNVEIGESINRNKTLETFFDTVKRIWNA